MAILLSTQAKRVAWANAGYLGRCRNGVWVNHLFFGKGIGGVPAPTVDAYRALETVHRAVGYIPYSRWAYNFRKMTGSSSPCNCSSYGGCSVHGFGIGVDIDPPDNPYSTAAFSWSRTKYTPSQIAAIEAIKNTKGEQVWSWGGRWQSVRDYMHFEIQVDPPSLAINWNTVQGGGSPAPTPPPTTGDDEIMLKLIRRHWTRADIQLFHDNNLYIGGVDYWANDLGVWANGEGPWDSFTSEVIAKGLSKGLLLPLASGGTTGGLKRGDTVKLT